MLWSTSVDYSLWDLCMRFENLNFKHTWIFKSPNPLQVAPPVWEKLVRPKLLLIFVMISFFRSSATPLPILVICPYLLVSLFCDPNGELSNMKPSCIMISTGNQNYQTSSLTPTLVGHAVTTSDLRPKLQCIEIGLRYQTVILSRFPEDCIIWW